MELINAIISFVGNADLMVRLFLLVTIAMYGLFAIVLAFQIRTLNNTIKQATFSSVFTFLSFLHAGIALALMLSVIMIL